jgi:CCR4-NOT complex subunit CAF16
MAEGTTLSLNHVNNYPEFDLFKTRHLKENRIDSPLMALCLSLLRQDQARERAKKAAGHKPQIDAWTGQPHTRWDDLSEDMKSHGDKYISQVISLYVWMNEHSLT